MKDVQLTRDRAIEICNAYHEIYLAGEFEFELRGEKCISQWIDGVQTFAIPDSIRQEFAKVIEAFTAFEAKISLADLERVIPSLFSGSICKAWRRR
jgi:hypothetical protein